MGNQLAWAGPRTVGRRGVLSRLRAGSPFSVLVLAIAAVVALLICYPLLRIVVGLVWDADEGFTIAAVTDTLALPGLAGLLRDTAIVVACSVAIALVVGSVFAWLNERTDARVAGLTDVLPIVNFLVPGIATALGWLLLLSSEAGYLNDAIRWVVNGVFGTGLESGPLDAHSWYAVIGVYALTLVPFVYLVVSAGLRNIDPRLEEQSRMCGASLRTTLLRVTLPALKPSLLSAMFLAVWFALAIFSVPVILAEPAGIHLISVEVVHLLTFGYPPRTGVAIGLSTLVMVVLGVIWLLQQRALASGRSAGIGGKTGAAQRIDLGAWRWVARATMSAYIVAALVLPVGALTLVTLNGFWGDIRWDQLSLTALGEVFADQRNLEAVTNSVRFAVVTATVAMVCAACVSWLSVRSPGTVARFASAILKVPAAIPPVVLAVGMLLALAGEPIFLGGTALLVVLGFLVIAMPEASITSEAAAGQIGRELGQASSIAGAGPATTFRRVYLPLMMPGLAAGWTLIFVRVMADVEASSLLASTQTPVIGFQLLSIFEGGGGYAELAALALFVTAVSVVTVSLVLGTTSYLQARRTRR